MFLSHWFSPSYRQELPPSRLRALAKTTPGFSCSLPGKLLLTLHAAAAAAKLLQSCPTLCNPIDGSPPGSAIPGILQARTPEWAASLTQKVTSSESFSLSLLV